MFAVEQRLKQKLKERFPAHMEQYFSVLSMSHEPDLVLQEELDWIALVAEGDSQSAVELIQHSLKYPFICFNILTPEQFFTIMRERVRTSKHEKARLLRRKREIFEEKEKIKKKQDELFHTLNDEEVKHLSTVLQVMGTKRFEIKNCWAGAEFYGLPLLEELSRRIGVTIYDFAFCYRFRDIENALLHQEKLSAEELEQREEYYILLLKDGAISFYSGNRAKRLMIEELGESLPDLHIKELHGTGAHPGKIVGNVRVVKCNDIEQLSEAIKEFQKGEILVTQMTQPNMVVLMHKVGAVVTDEGGIVSHAAVIAREFNVPCVVGTRFATRIFKTGNAIEVDATNGIVRKIK